MRHCLSETIVWFVVGPIVAGIILLVKAAKYSCVAVSEVQGPP